MGFADPDLSRDAFLGGRVMAWQPRRGYRAATDPVFLAAGTEVTPGQSVLDLGCGVGVASLCLSARLPGLSITGVERQAVYADLARRNAAEAAAPLEVVTADLTDLPAALRRRSFDHVIANPPYFAPGAGPAAADPGREAALREETPMAQWAETARRRLAPKGWLTVIQAADRLPDLIAALAPHFGSLSVRPLVPRAGRPAGRVLIRARKDGRAPFTLLSPLVVHSGDAHLRDADDFSARAAAILRDGGALAWG